MVAVALSPQVKEIPLSLGAAPAAPAPPVSAEEHIANLKAAARGSPDGAASGNAGAVNGHNSDAYLPPREVARSIPCRFYPNCHYREKCIFYHPPPVVIDDEAALQHQQQVSVNGSANGYPASAQSPTNGYDAAGQYMQQQQQQPGFYGGYDAQQQNAEYLHYLAATGQHGYLPPHLQHQQAAFYAYPGQQQQQQQQSQQPNGYGQQPQYQSYYHPQQGMYASIPPSMYPQHIYPGMSPPSQSFEQPLSPTSPTSPAPVNGETPADPAIISQSPRNSATHPSSSSDAPKSASSPVDTDGKVNGSAHADQAAHTNGTSPVSVPLSGPTAHGAYYPVAAIPMPLEALQAQFGTYSTPQHANGDAQAQLEADFARGSLSGHSTSAENGDSSNGKHERTQSAQMKTLYQTGNAKPNTSSALPAGNAEAQTFVPAVAAPAAAVPTNALSASTARLPIHTGPRMHEALNGSYHPGHRRDLSSSSALSSSKGPRSFGPSSSAAANGGSRHAGVAPHRNGPPRPFDPNRPVPQCRYFSDGGCRFGDLCFFSHTLRKALPVPGASDGRTTFDAKALKANIGDPDGNVNTTKLRHPGKTPFSNSAVAATANGSWNGAQRFQQLSPSANHAPLASGAAQPNGTEQYSAKDSQAIAASTEEQLQKLISEMPRQLNGTSAAPAPGKSTLVPASNGQSATAAPRTAIPPTLGQRPPTAPRHHHQQNGPHPHSHHQQQHHRGTSSQRIPSGENDFPALHNGAAGSSASRERSSSASGRSVADVVAAPAPAPVPSSTAASANKAVEQRPSSSTEAATEAKVESATPAAPSAAAASSAPTAAAERAQPKPAPASALAPAPAKVAAAPVSWASRAAQAASLPDPPKSKARPAATSAASAQQQHSAVKAGKEDKKEKPQPTEAGKKGAIVKEAEVTASQSVVPAAATAAAAAVPAVAA